jgi:outer membrane murein-binding lipoprotein Lpp
MREETMSKNLLFAGALAFLVGGCASSAETERTAQVHDQRARQAAAYEDYDRAADEKREALKLHAKAAQERADEYPEHQTETPPAPPPPADYVPPPPPVP